MRNQRQLRPLLRENYTRRSLTPLFLKPINEFPRAKSICSATTDLLKVPTHPEAERFIKSSRRHEYGQLLRARHPKPAVSAPLRHIAWSCRRYLLRKRAVVRLQRCVRDWLRRRQAGRVIVKRWKEGRMQKRQRKVRKWLFLLCLWVKSQAQYRLLSLSHSALTIQCHFRRFLCRTQLPSPSPTPNKPFVKRKTLVEDFKRFVVSSQIEQAVIAFRWNLELTRKRKLVLQGLKQLHSAVATALVRHLGPGLEMIRRNYEECERARKYRMKKERQAQRFLIRDRKTILSLSHKLALVTTSHNPETVLPPESGFLLRIRSMIHSLLSSFQSPTPS